MSGSRMITRGILCRCISKFWPFHLSGSYCSRAVTRPRSMRNLPCKRRLPTRRSRLTISRRQTTWKFAQPKDDVIRGKWWEMFNDPQLNALEEQVNISNQNIALADANFHSARALVKESRSQLFPTVTTSPSIITSRQSSRTTQSNVGAGQGVITDYSLPFDVTWEPDLWG